MTPQPRTSRIVRSQWSCGTCHNTGTIEHGPYAPIGRLMDIVRVNHVVANADCPTFVFGGVEGLRIRPIVGGTR